MSSHCKVPNWNLRQQRQEQGEVRSRSPHVQSEQDFSYVVPMSNHEVAAELTWENGQVSLHELSGIDLQAKQTWESSRPGDSTLESIVHQATTFKHGGEDHVKYSRTSIPTSSSTRSMEQQHIQPAPAPSSGGKWRENSSHMQVEQNGGGKAHTPIPITKWTENSAHMQMEQNREVEVKANSVPSAGKYWGENSSADNLVSMNKRVRSEQLSQHNNHNQMEEMSRCGSASATFCRETDTTMMTWPNSYESPRSLKTARNTDNEDSVYHDHDCSENQDGEGIIKSESFRSQSSVRRSRAAAVHNQSERRRRDRINQKMKALQKLVPNASKTDKASMLDEVIEYLKQLQAQVYMMNNARNMVMPLGMQQLHHQMSFLARMGMSMGMGMGMNSFPPLIHAAGGGASSFISPPPFAMPPVLPTPAPPLKANVDAASVVPNFNDAYNTFLAQQSMNMDFLNKISALYRQQGSQLQPSATFSLPNDGQPQ